MGESEEIIFFPDSAGSFVGILAIVVVLGGIAMGVQLYRRRDQLPDKAGWFGVVILIGLGVFLGWFTFGEARSLVIVSPQQLELRYRWPRPATRLETADLADVRIEYRGTKKPSPRLVLETRRGEVFESEGTTRSDRVQLAKARLDRLRRQALDSP